MMMMIVKRFACLMGLWLTPASSHPVWTDETTRTRAKKCMTSSPHADDSTTTNALYSSPPRDCLLSESSDPLRFEPMSHNNNSSITRNSTAAETTLVPTLAPASPEESPAGQHPALVTWMLTIVTLDLISSPLSNLQCQSLENVITKKRAKRELYNKNRGRKGVEILTTTTGSSNSEAFQQIVTSLQQGEPVRADQYCQLWSNQLKKDQLEEAIFLLFGHDQCHPQQHDAAPPTGMELLHLLPNDDELEPIYHQIARGCQNSNNHRPSGFITKDHLVDAGRLLFGVETIAEDMMDVADLNRDGQVSWDEFEQLLESLVDY